MGDSLRAGFDVAANHAPNERGPSCTKIVDEIDKLFKAEIAKVEKAHADATETYNAAKGNYDIAAKELAAAEEWLRRVQLDYDAAVKLETVVDMYVKLSIRLEEITIDADVQKMLTDI